MSRLQAAGHRCLLDSATGNSLMVAVEAEKIVAVGSVTDAGETT